MSLADEEERQRAEAERPAAEQRIIEARRPDRPAPTPTSRARARPRWRRRPLLIALVALLVIGAIVGGVDWWIVTSRWISTDDAFIDTHMVQISPQLAGRVEAVLVGDNQKVRAGQPVVELDPADYHARLDQAVANQQSAEGQLAQAKAQLPVAEANLNEAKAQVAVAQAAAANAEIALKRDRLLARMGGLAISQQTIDNDTATCAQRRGQPGRGTAEGHCRRRRRSASTRRTFRRPRPPARGWRRRSCRRASTSATRSSAPR